MTYSQIFYKLYKKNKKLIVTYVTLSLLFSILAFGNGNTAFASVEFTTSEIVTNLGGSGGAMLAPLTLAQGCLTGIDASSALLFLSATALILDFIEKEGLSRK